MLETIILPKKLEESIQNNNLVIFVGAGCSIPLKFPSWKGLIEDILTELQIKVGKDSIINFQNILDKVQSDNISLFDALNRIENDVDHGNAYKQKVKEIINNKIEILSKDLPEESAVHSLLWKISQKIITTNYDKILEKYKPENLSPKIFDNTNTYQALKSQTNDSQFLYKIHGDYENPKSIILFESDYNDIYINQNHNTDSLNTFFKDKTFLFIGFSLTDPFINALLKKIKKIYEGYTVNEHFIFTTKNEDFIEFDVTTIKIENWKDSLLEYLKAIEKIKVSSDVVDFIPKNITTDKVDEKELTSNDVANVVELIAKKTKELLSNPSDKELNKEIKDLRGKLDKILFEKIDYLQEVDKPFRSADLQILFDKIYSSENLDNQTLEQIRKVRDNREIYKWHDRSVIVSAITCSLIHFNKADEQKINLLIDFTNDNEEKVWQKALASLFIGLNHLGNKWLRSNSLKIKIKSLNENSRIQNACATILQLFNIGLNNVSMINEELFTNFYFSESPFNYFLPYYQEENPAFDIIYENYEGNDIEKFISIINQAPIPDQLKYLFCGQKQNEDYDENKNSDVSSILHKILHLNSMFYPYSIYIQEIISFYKYFPIYKHEEKLKSQLKLTETPLKDYLLNAKEKYSALGSHFMQEKNWSQAIVNYREAIKIEQNNTNDLLNLANCYNKSKDYINEIIFRNRIEKIDDKNEKNIYALFDFYFKTEKDFNKSLELSNRLIDIDNENADFLYLRGLSYKELKEYTKAFDDYNKAIDINPEKSIFYSSRSLLHYLLKDVEKSMADLNNAILYNNKNDMYYFRRSDLYYVQNKYEEANKDLDAAISINKDPDYYLSRATNYITLSLFDKALSDIKEAENLGTAKATIYHIYSNYYRFINDFDKAFEYIDKAENLEKHWKFTGTRATIYASMGDDDNFYKFLEDAFLEGAEADSLLHDIIKKYENNSRFIDLLKKHNQVLQSTILVK